MSKLLSNLFKTALVSAVVYGAYKFGEKKGKESVEKAELPLKEYSPMDMEIFEVENMIQTLKEKPNKTRRDRDNLELLEIKLKQLKRNR